MQLSQNFKLSEFLKSDVGEAAGIKNEPDELVIARLRQLAETLELLRNIIGAPITIKSGYRNRALNTLVDGSATSAHMQGWAADIKVKGHTPRLVAKAIVESNIKFDQVILESVSEFTPDGVWVHISIAPTNRREVKTMKPVNGKKKYEKGLQ